MATKAKDVYAPRFDFGSNLDAEGKQTATIRELLDEINFENGKTIAGDDGEAKESSEDGVHATFESLRVTLGFIKQITGRAPWSISEELSLSALKTIKLLYVTNDTSDTQMFRLLKSPKRGGRPTLDFYTTETPSRNEKGIAIVSNLLAKMSVEMDADRLRKIDASFLTYAKLLECIEIENFEIIEPIYTQHTGNSAAISASFRHLTEAINGYMPRRYESARPLHETIYTYVRSLPFFHFVYEHHEILSASKIEGPIGPIDEKIGKFCEELSQTSLEPIRYNTPTTCIEEFANFVESNALTLAKLIKDATGITSERRDLLKIINPSSKVLAAYAFHQWGKMPLSVMNISVADCIAALCTIRYQQKAKTNYTSYWLGQKQVDKNTSVLGQLDETRSVEDLYEEDYAPQGINLLLYSRFGEFHMAFIGQLERHQAWTDLQVARLRKYADCYLSNDVDANDRSVMNFHIYCQHQAIQASRLTVP